MRKDCCGSAYLSQAIAVPSTRERLVVIAYLSPAAPVAGASLEALCQVLGQCPSLGARTGRALQNGLHTGREQTIGCTIGEGPSVWGALWAMPLAVPPAGGPRSGAAAGARGTGAPTMTPPALTQRARRPLSQWYDRNGQDARCPRRSCQRARRPLSQAKSDGVRNATRLRRHVSQRARSASVQAAPSS